MCAKLGPYCYSQEDTWETEACTKVDDLLESFMGIRDTELGKYKLCDVIALYPVFQHCLFHNYTNRYTHLPLEILISSSNSPTKHHLVKLVLYLEAKILVIQSDAKSFIKILAV